MKNENKERKKIRNFIKVNKPVGIVVAVLACLVLVGVSYTVYSKYYKTGYNPGMATASGFYFNSNYMAPVEELKTMDMDPTKMKDISEDVLNSIILSTNRTPWVGNSDYPLHINVRNYDNQLLYNDKDLDVVYEVNFMLLDEPNVGRYRIEYGSESRSLEKRGNVVTFSDMELPGGKLNQHEYTLRVAMADGEDANAYKPARVLMVAYPTGPEYLKKTKVIAGILRVSYEERKFKIDPASGFLIRKNSEYEKDNAWKNVILAESGFEYQLYTSGNFTGSGGATRKTIEVRWRKDMYQISEFNEYYQEVKGDTTRYYTDGDEQVMKIDILPYSSLKFVFFRAPEFEEVIKAEETTKEVFEKSVKVTVVEDNVGNP